MPTTMPFPIVVLLGSLVILPVQAQSPELQQHVAEIKATVP